MVPVKATLEPLRVGDTFLTKYHVRGLLGRGGQAAVFHGYDTYIDRDVAIKVMADASDAKREHSRRAQMEARVLCKLHHPNIVNVFDAGTTEDGLIYIIMELLRGRTLREVIRHVHKVTVFEALSLGAQIADGVELAHQQHVVHRDLKPENIFVVENNAVKVLDFGIAKFLALTGITTQRDTLRGTMWYISPEHVQGFGVTARSDIYALGSILYEIIAGTPPCLLGLEEITTQSVVFSQISRMPPQLHDLVPSVPPHVGRVIHRMLMKDPARRYGTMKEVAEALRLAATRLQVEHSALPLEPRDLWRDPRVLSLNTDAPKGEIEVADTLEGTPSQPAQPNQPGATPVTLTAPRISRRAATVPELAGDTIGAKSGAVAFFALRSRVVASALALGAVAGILLGFARSRADAPSAKPTDTAASTANPQLPGPHAPGPMETGATPLPSSDGPSIPSAAPTSRKETNPLVPNEPSNSSATPTRANKRSPARSTEIRKGQTHAVRPPFSGVDLD